MSDILNYLESVTQPDSMGPEHTALMQKLLDLERPLQKSVPLNDWDRISEARSALLMFEGQECFSRGFRLGVQLMLAAQAQLL